MEDLSIDEIVTVIEDAYDASVSPKRMQRVDNNKLHLIFKANGAGYQKINKSVLSLKQRLDPELCDDADLPMTAKIVGTEFIKGKASMLNVVASNVSTVDSATLYAGTYQYESSSGEVFSFTVQIDVLLSPLETREFKAASANIGSFAVSENASISLTRTDGATIDSNISFACDDNTTYIGYPAESALEFRQRMTTDAQRQDEVNEIEADIKALQNVFECNCVFNPLNSAAVYDGITLNPKELLIIITGVPTDEIANIVAARSCYATHQVLAANVVYYYNARYIGGRYPVYFKYHDFYEYSITVYYSYDSNKLKFAQVEAAFDIVLSRYKTTNRHVDDITPFDIENDLSAVALANVKVKGIGMTVAGVEVPNIVIPKTRLPKLVTVTYERTATVGG